MIWLTGSDQTTRHGLSPDVDKTIKFRRRAVAFCQDELKADDNFVSTNRDRDKISIQTER